MASSILERTQSQCPAPVPERSPRLEIEWDHEEKRFRVQVGTMYYGWFVDIPSNRKAVVVFLREMYDSETGRWVFTEEELAGLLGSANRQAVDGHMKGYRDVGGDLLAFLKGQRKVDDAVVQLVWQVFCVDAYASVYL